MKQNNETKTAEEMGYVLFTDKKPANNQSILFWESGDKEWVYDAVNNNVIGRYKLPKYWKPAPQNNLKEDDAAFEFTPGKWEAKRFDPNSIIIRSKFGTICNISHPHEDKEAEANARLISAAPAMYRALKNFCEAMGNGFEAEKIAYDNAKAILQRIQNK